MRRRINRPHLPTCDQLFSIALARIWRHWRTAVVLVQPATVVRWHRAFLLTTAPVGEIPTRVAIGRVSFRLRCGRCWL